MKIIACKFTYNREAFVLLSQTSSIYFSSNLYLNSSYTLNPEFFKRTKF